jgi:hypothetical protein
MGASDRLAAGITSVELIMKTTRRITLVLIVLASLEAAFAQSSQTNRRVEPARPIPSEAISLIEQDRVATFQLVQSLIDRVRKFENTEARIHALVSLGDVLWTTGGDEALARQLFLTSYNQLKALKPVESNERTVSNNDDGKDAALTVSKVSSLRSYIIRYLARHDAGLAQRWATQPNSTAGASGSASGHIDTALELLRDGQADVATRFAQLGLNQGINGVTVTLNVVTFLNRLRGRDEKAGNQLFLETLSHLVKQRQVDANDLLIIGNYVFTSSALPPDMLSPERIFIAPIRVGNVNLQADVSADQPNMSPAMARAYLDAAALVLNRSVPDVNERLRYRATSYLLLMKAQHYAPDIVHRFAAVASGDGFTPPMSLPQSPTISPTRPIDTSPMDLAAVMKKIEEIGDDLHRDEYSLRMVGYYYRKDDLASARAIADRIHDLALRSRLLSLIDYRQIAKSLERGEVDSIEQRIDKLPAGLERVVMSLAAVRIFLERGDQLRARRHLDVAFNDARGNVETPTRAFAILAIAEILSQFDAATSASALREAVQAFNNSKGESASVLRLEQTAKATIGNRSETFRTTFGWSNLGNLQRALKPLILADSQGTIDAILDLKNEHILGQSIVAITSVFLSKEYRDRFGSERSSDN